ncbi:TetR/AcrR family transcriptional regulator C-terminal domain-containing protein [Nocardioides mangrovi]|uniref:TetR/AcrR family transcriptional regulator C-terminal domain-containing protein n=1 Tax=Nocardioides mangrovi TaxID=2874580 RepID=A0ABS7UFN2_9ACTN|nr:TetR/AcrR family transcriptional regulator C-terminal domain-containing protein [Nocardioides mangrovi]MBZ5739819.1 TetR/AcrR family transcriptional regulator C-terminal domain-containing protein [Nocardioides mangrovi]
MVKGTKERLSRETVTRAAVSLADSEGIEALTIRRLATDLGVTPMALYWHFKDKDALFDGIAEAVLAEVELPEETGAETWDGELRVVLDALCAALAAHPAVAELVKGRFLQNDAGCEITERVLALLRAGGFSTEQASQLAVYALLFMVGLVTGMPGLVIGSDEEEREQAVRRKWASLQALSPKRFPCIIESSASLTDCAASDQWLDDGMDTLMAGIRGRA